MSTYDVPGANAANGDQLKMGAWAEHEDGSLLFVKSTEQDRVVYEMFDLAADPPQVYTDAMPMAGFKRTFTPPPIGTSKEKWTWHDKTPFPWDRIVGRTPVPRPQPATADHVLTAAERVAKSLRLRGRALVGERYRHMTEATRNRVRQVWDTIDEAIRSLLP